MLFYASCMLLKIRCHGPIASFPDFPAPERRAWYFSARGHDVIKIGPEFLEQNGNVFRVVQPTMHSTFCVYDIHSPIVRYRICSIRHRSWIVAAPPDIL